MPHIVTGTRTSRSTYRAKDGSIRVYESVCRVIHGVDEPSDEEFDTFLSYVASGVAPEDACKIIKYSMRLILKKSLSRCVAASTRAKPDRCEQAIAAQDAAAPLTSSP